MLRGLTEGVTNWKSFLDRVYLCWLLWEEVDIGKNKGKKELLSWRTVNSEEPLLNGRAHGTVTSGSLSRSPSFCLLPLLSSYRGIQNNISKHKRDIPLGCRFKSRVLSLSFKTFNNWPLLIFQTPLTVDDPSSSK